MSIAAFACTADVFSKNIFERLYFHEIDTIL